MHHFRSSCWSAFIFVACSAGCLTGCSDGERDTTATETRADGLRGELRRVVISDPERGTSRFDYFLELADGQWLPLALPEGLDLEPNLRVLVEGELVDRVYQVRAIAPEISADEGVGQQQAPLLAPSPKRVAVVLFNFTNDTSQPIDAARAKELVFSGTSSSNAYYKEVSYGLRSLVGTRDVAGDVFGWYTLDQTNDGCAYQDWGTAARAKAQGAGVDLSSYDHVVHYFPRPPAVNSLAWANSPANTIGSTPAARKRSRTS